MPRSAKPCRGGGGSWLRAQPVSWLFSLRALLDPRSLHRRNSSCRWANYNAAIQTKRTVVPTNRYLVWEFLPYAAQGTAIMMWRRRQASRADRHLHWGFRDRRCLASRFLSWASPPSPSFGGGVTSVHSPSARAVQARFWCDPRNGCFVKTRLVHFIIASVLTRGAAPFSCPPKDSGYTSTRCPFSVATSQAFWGSTPRANSLKNWSLRKSAPLTH